MLLPFGGKVPRDEGAVFVAPNATVLGDVVLGPGSSVWYGAVLRGDDGTLTLGENTNVQDNAVLHCDPGGAVTLGKNVTVGHCALVHGCTVGDGSLIGMHATLLNHCVVGKNCIIGAGALVRFPCGGGSGEDHQAGQPRAGGRQPCQCRPLCGGGPPSRRSPAERGKR
jgi:carbonic anhydrase/acetyltransferase-like protein (isoleucine patch superfamily)